MLETSLLLSLAVIHIYCCEQKHQKQNRVLCWPVVWSRSQSPRTTSWLYIEPTTDMLVCRCAPFIRRI